MGYKEKGLKAAKGANGILSLVVAGIFAAFAARRGNDQDDHPTLASLGYGVSSFVPNLFLNYVSLDKLGRVLGSSMQDGCAAAVLSSVAFLWALTTAPIGYNLGDEAANEFGWLADAEGFLALLGAVNMVATRFVGAHALITSMLDAYHKNYPSAFRQAVQRELFGPSEQKSENQASASDRAGVAAAAAERAADNVSTDCCPIGCLFSVLCRQMAAPMLPLFVSMAENGFKTSIGHSEVAAAMAWPAGLVTQVFYMHSAEHLYANMAPYVKKIRGLCSEDKRKALGWFLGFTALSVMSYFSGAGFSEDAKERVMPKNSTVEEAFGVAGPIVSHFPSFLIEIYPVIAMIAAGMFANGGASFHFVIDWRSPVPEEIRSVTQQNRGDNTSGENSYGAIAEESGTAQSTQLATTYQHFNSKTHEANLCYRLSEIWRRCQGQSNGPQDASSQMTPL